MDGQSGDRFVDAEDPVSTYDEYDEDWDNGDEETEVTAGTTDPTAESLVVELVERLSGRDLDSVAELFHSEAESNFLRATDRAELLVALGDLFERYPTLVLTRGELGDEAVAAAWILGTEGRDHELMGVLRFEWDTVDDEAVLTRIELFEPGDDDDVLLEEPDATEIAEWEDWNLTDEG